MILSIFLLTCGAGLLWIPYAINSGPEWVQIAGVVLAIICGLSAAGLFVNYAANEIICIRKANYQATTGIQLRYATEFTQALKYLTTEQTKYLFDLAILTAHGLPGIPIVWRIDFPGGAVGLSVLHQFLEACCEIYNEADIVHELWPVRDHNQRKFGPDAEHELRVITEWLVMNNYAMPARGNRAATWAQGVHPLDVMRGMGLEE